MELKSFFKEYPKIALGFSGGVDSSYLLYAAHHYGADIGAYYVKTAFQPAFELEDAKRVAAQIGVGINIIELDVFSQPTVLENTSERCYHCKNVIFGTLVEHARRDGYQVIIDGTNASDDADDRPGMQALREMSVLSPLRQCGITKAEVRERSKEAGLHTWDKPAYACLATRVPTDTPITKALLEKVEAAEDFLFGQGFSDFRVRTLAGNARLQLPETQLPKLIEERETVLEKLEELFPAVLLDLETRIGE